MSERAIRHCPPRETGGNASDLVSDTQSFRKDVTMAAASSLLTDPRMTAAIAELTDLIRGAYPETTFSTDTDEHEGSVFVTAVVDVDDPDEVVDRFIDRLVTLQVDEGLPLHIVPIRTPARREKLFTELRDQQRRQRA